MSDYKEMIHACAVSGDASHCEPLLAELAALRAEVDACGEIIGQPPGAKGGHAEIIADTIASHQRRLAELSGEVARLRDAERIACIRAVCPHCRDGVPITEVGYGHELAHGIELCAAVGIRERAALAPADGGKDGNHD